MGYTSNLKVSEYKVDSKIRLWFIIVVYSAHYFIILLMYMAFDESPQGTTLEEMKIMCDFIIV